jgi:glutathione S-transferase
VLTVHHLGISQSERIVWLCEELGLEYQMVRHERRSDTRGAPDSIKELHPMGIAPIITDGDVVLAESGAICDYIIAKYGRGRLVPAVDSPDFPDHLFWFHFANGTFMTISMMELAVTMSGATAQPPLVTDRKARAWALAESRVGEAPYFGGAELTTADIMMGFSLTTMRAFGGVDLAPYPNLRDYLQRIGKREAYRRAMAKAEPGMEPQLG